jgi:hypothetical protein
VWFSNKRTPATLVADDTGNAVGETSAGLFGGVEMFDCHFVLPTVFQAQAGKMYWIQIEASQYGYPLTWGNATGSGGNNAHYRRMGNNCYSGSGTHALDVVVNPSATPKTGYSFVNWTENGTIVSSSALFSVSAAADRTLVANFQPSWQLTLTSSSTTMGTVAGAGTYVTGSSVTATATAKPGYVFLNRKEGTNIVCTTPVYAFIMIAPRTLVANFAVGYAVAAGSSLLPGGSVSGAGGYATGSNVFLSARASPGYRFTGWTENGSIVSENTNYSFSAAANRTLVANFVPIVGIDSSALGSIVLTSPASANGWLLEESTNLSTWLPSSLPVNSAGGQNTATAPTTGGGRLFRLSHP